MERKKEKRRRRRGEDGGRERRVISALEVPHCRQRTGKTNKSNDDDDSKKMKNDFPVYVTEDGEQNLCNIIQTYRRVVWFCFVFLRFFPYSFKLCFYVKLISAREKARQALRESHMGFSKCKYIILN